MPQPPDHDISKDSFLEEATDAFSLKDRNGGDKLFSRGAVMLIRVGRDAFQGIVRDGTVQRVSLKIDDEGVWASCTCNEARDTSSCRHIWAAMLELDALVDETEEDDGSARPSAKGRRPTKAAERHAAWRSKLDGALAPAPLAPPKASRKPPYTEGELLYVVDAHATLNSGNVTLLVMHHRPKRSAAGGWTIPKVLPVGAADLLQLPQQEDREILAALLGVARGRHGYYYGYGANGGTFTLEAGVLEWLLPRMAATGRLRIRKSDGGSVTPLTFDAGDAWDFHVAIDRDDADRCYVLRGELRRGEERRSLESPVVCLRDGWVFWSDQGARLETHGAFNLLAALRREKEIRIPVGKQDELLDRLLRAPALPPMDLPPEMHYEEVQGVPHPHLFIRKPKYAFDDRKLAGELSFEYGEQRVAANHPGLGIYSPDSRRLLRRDPAAEAACLRALQEVGFRARNTYEGELPELPAAKLPHAVSALLRAGWTVEAEDLRYRRPGDIDLDVTTGIDWFELHGSADFEGKPVPLPELLAALRKGEDFVRLDDGSLGVLPEEWLKKYGLLAQMGEAEGDHLRFSRGQVGILDALLAAQGEARCDEAFARMRQQLRQFDSIAPAEAPPSFQGELRTYQREGLGWLHFLRRFALGGCLADDMGLGKTIQVLALLEARRRLHAGLDAPDDTDAALAPAQRPRTSLAVVPRSLIWNWQQEAQRFCPELRILDHTGTQRGEPSAAAFGEYDLVLTTYGTLRSDAVHLKGILFDYVILDEAQAIKNARTASAKAVRLLHARHRLCLSGTPIENHLGELWSLFEFLNPGMLGASTVLTTLTKAQDPQARALLARAVRPFLLRRTKTQVAKDLPERTEQTLHCELDPKQRKLYDELRDHYRASLLGRIDRDGMSRSKMHVLEALLRLRQAACHPGLIDESRRSHSSAKLDTLLANLAEVLDEGHKVLVFSQFTSLLDIVRMHLDKENVRYEYLDGQTRDRQAPVDRFQNNPDSRLFLISLKAGGLGLNLTAAEYVFLLDPWWNPAVEAQAIDRAHRIGQTQRVFAYRLIAKDTVEEKVLELQQTKRDLADAILSADNSVIGALTREDLELLLA